VGSGLSPGKRDVSAFSKRNLRANRKSKPIVGLNRGCPARVQRNARTFGEELVHFNDLYIMNQLYIFYFISHKMQQSQLLSLMWSDKNVDVFWFGVHVESVSVICVLSWESTAIRSQSLTTATLYFIQDLIPW